MDSPVQRFAELAQRTDAPARSTWGLWGPEDDLGSINLLTPERVARAATLVRRGAVFSLDLPLDAFDPALSKHRGSVQHTIFQVNDNHRDDRLDNFYLQSTSQLDGLRHFRHWEYGFYNGAADDEIGVGKPRLGVGRWAQHGIVGRGVLLDVERHYRATGRTIEPLRPQPISPQDLDDTARAQGVALEPGDVILMRTGWLTTVLAQTPEERRQLQEHLVCAGIEQSDDMLAWLWDHQVSLLASDNVAVEAYPAPAHSPFVSQAEAAGDGLNAHTGMLHRILIPLMGLALGELWNLDPLAADCAEDAVWEFMLVSTPLQVVGGVGSPANAVAIK